MEELEIKVTQQLGSITTNFDELEKELTVQMSAYKDFVVSEDEITIAKSDLAFLRKLKTSIENRRKEIKKSYLTPYNQFEDSCKKLTAIIDEPIGTIDSQLKLFEEERATKKHERVTKLYEEEMGEFLRFLPVIKNYNPKWDNKSTTDNDIRFEISEMRLKVKKDLEVIKNLNSEIEEDIINAYANSGNDLSVAIQRNQQYLSDKQKIEQAKAEQEKAEQEKIEEAKVEVVKVEPVQEPVEVPVEEVEPVEKDTVSFVVSKEDAETVRQYLTFSEISFTEE